MFRNVNIQAQFHFQHHNLQGEVYIFSDSCPALQRFILLRIISQDKCCDVQAVSTIILAILQVSFTVWNAKIRFCAKCFIGIQQKKEILTKEKKTKSHYLISCTKQNFRTKNTRFLEKYVVCSKGCYLQRIA